MGYRTPFVLILLAGVLFLLAGTQAAILDVVESEQRLAASIYSEAPRSIALKSASANWAYVDRDPANGEAFPFASSIARGVTDLWHWSQFWQIMFAGLGGLLLFWAGYLWPYNMKFFKRLGVTLLILILAQAAYRFGFEGMAGQVLPKGGMAPFQSAASLWLDWYLSLHEVLRAAGHLG